MDSANPETAQLDARARRARVLLLLATAVLIVAPFVAFLLAGRGAAHKP